MKLSEKILIEVCKKALENSRELISDADLLKENNRLPRAYTLYQIAIEESGKAIYCFVVMFQGDYDDINVQAEFKEAFLSHLKKTEKSRCLNPSIAQILFKGDIKGALTFLQESMDERYQLKKINNLKNNSLYTNLIDSEVINPSEVITLNILTEIEKRAKLRFKAINAFVTLGINHLSSIRDYQKANPNIEFDVDEMAKEYWSELLS